MPLPSSVASRRLAVVALCLAALTAERAGGQSAQAVRGAQGGITVGGDLNEYLRYLQTLGQVPLMPWSMRGFSPQIVDSITAVAGTHPWQQRWLFERATTPQWFTVLPADVTVQYNSSYPYGINEGPVWAGHGVTTSVSAGVAGAWGPLSVVLKPLAFWAQNQSFPLQPTGVSGNGQYADPMFPKLIDRPQRFGNAAYSRIEPGETTVRLDEFGMSVGATTANEWWGPASVFPYLVGDNAAGVPHVFIGTERPTGIFVGQLQVRVEYGLEFQSPYSPVVGPDTIVNVDSTGTRRLMSGLVLSFTPAGIPGLELGAGRYFHRPWSGRVTAGDIKSPFESLLLASSTTLSGTDATALANQLASVWGRWVFPHSGLEVYSEYGHEDHNIDTRDLYSELDHSRVAVLGLRKAFRQDSTRFDGLRAEVFDGTAPTTARHRGEGAIYLHSPILQGHTEEGKVIGAAAGVGSPAAAVLAWDRFRASGHTTLYAIRTSENEPVSGRSSNPKTAMTLGLRSLHFASPADVSIDVAATHTTRDVATNTGGWNATLTVSASVH